MGDEGKKENEGQGGGAGTQDAGGAKDQKTFSQDELNRVVEERLARERGKFKDYDDLKKKAGEWEKAEQARMSEQEKLQKAAKDLEAKVAELQGAATAREAEIQQRLIRAEVRTVAATMQFISPEDAHSLADLAGVTVGEDGTIKGVKEALEKLVKAKPYLVQGNGAGGGTPQRGKPPGKDGKQEQARPVIHF